MKHGSSQSARTAERLVRTLGARHQGLDAKARAAEQLREMDPETLKLVAPMLAQQAGQVGHPKVGILLVSTIAAAGGDEAIEALKRVRVKTPALQIRRLATDALRTLETGTVRHPHFVAHGR